MRISDWSSDVCSSDLGRAVSLILLSGGLSGLDAVLKRLELSFIFLLGGLLRFRGRFGLSLDPLPTFFVAAKHFHHLHLLALAFRSEEHTSELQSLMRISYAVLC